MKKQTNCTAYKDGNKTYYEYTIGKEKVKKEVNGTISKAAYIGCIDMLEHAKRLGMKDFTMITTSRTIYNNYIDHINVSVSSDLFRCYCVLETLLEELSVRVDIDKNSV